MRNQIEGPLKCEDIVFPALFIITINRHWNGGDKEPKEDPHNMRIKIPRDKRKYEIFFDLLCHSREESGLILLFAFAVERTGDCLIGPDICAIPFLDHVEGNKGEENDKCDATLGTHVIP
mmetsp:Transcript_27733/g.46916  ORF Transcript_27733/g.46916 Transcript_27733/m.46916 type:complete len:120 (-) Transcript_27733:274-633(-)